MSQGWVAVPVQPVLLHSALKERYPSLIFLQTFPPHIDFRDTMILETQLSRFRRTHRTKGRMPCNLRFDTGPTGTWGVHEERHRQ
jgi:hypothetical protein